MNERNRIRLYDDMSMGPNVGEIDNLLKNGNNDNANMSYNPETLHKYTADASLKRYSLIRMLPGHLSESHLNGDIHIHDLEYFAYRPLNCLQHDLRFFIRNGLKVDGTGLHTSASKPAKNIETLVNHSGQIMGAGQINMSGGQGIPVFNVFFAPYASGLSYERIKQAMQMWVFNQNMSYVSRGGQAVFSTVGLEFSVPDWLRDEPAWGPGGVARGTYGDYEDETRTILKAFTEVLLEGDGYGKPHLFPNTVYNLRKDSFREQEIMGLVHELSAKFSAPYFSKELKDGGYANVMGCRTRLNSNWTGDSDLDTVRTGNLAYISLNLPRYALGGNFWDDLTQAMDDAKEILLLRRAHADRVMKAGLLKFLSQEDKDESSGSSYYRIDNATLSFGVVGLSDALRVLTGEPITNKSSRRLGHQIMAYINDYIKRCQNETGYRWTVLQTPAESTAHKFATMDKRLYPSRAPVHGERGGYYYTNSTHVDVDYGGLITEKIQAESNFHQETGGGHIFHGFFGESHFNPSSVQSLTKKIYDNSNLGFWTYTSAYSICTMESKLYHGIHETCPECGGNVEVYDRITGYMQRVSGWNKGKQAEFKDRRRF